MEFQGEEYLFYKGFKLDVAILRGTTADENGNITCVHAEYDPASKGGNSPDGRKVKGTIHWVAAKYAKDIEIALYDKLFTIPNLNDMAEGETYDDYLNRDSVKLLKGCKAEASLSDENDRRYQFVRTGYFIKDSKNDNRFIRIVDLKDSFGK